MAERKLFGTDGVRGTANRHPMTADIALKLGRAAGQYFMRGSHRHRVVIAKDTRLSGYMIEPALTAGFVSAGMDVMLVGPLPTPAVAMLTRSMRADLGVMISASHNPYEDNGIKLFGPDGYKLSDQSELEIERLIEIDGETVATPSDKLGRARRLEDARGRYIEYAKQSFPRRFDLTGLRIGIDCANGAAYQVGPIILQELGADVVSMGTNPDGFNINDNCGSTHPSRLQQLVLDHKLDVGIALDGDADRLVMCDEQGRLLDGDQLIAMIATDWRRRKKLTGDGVVTTLMSNLGLEKYLQSLDLKLLRTKVGDRYVVEAMRETGWNLGGEQSGHIVMTDHATTGDGLMAALQVLTLVVQQERPVSEAAELFPLYPQILQNVRYITGDPLENPTVKQAVAEAEQELKDHGRLLLRKSGTEPLIRVMAEGEDGKQVKDTVTHLCSVIEQAVREAAHA